MNGSVRNAIRTATKDLIKARVYAFGTGGDGVSLAANTDVYVSLLTCDDDPNYDVVTTDSTIAECQPNSQITSIKLLLVLKAAQSQMHEIMLFRDRDGALATITPEASAFGIADYTTVVDAARKNIIGYMPYYLTSQADARPRGVRVSPQALRRAGKMHDGDVLKLLIRNVGGTSANWWLFGNINYLSA